MKHKPPLKPFTAKQKKAMCRLKIIMAVTMAISMLMR